MQPDFRTVFSHKWATSTAVEGESCWRYVVVELIAVRYNSAGRELMRDLNFWTQLRNYIYVVMHSQADRSVESLFVDVV